MSLAPTYEAIRRETRGKPLLREKTCFLGTGHQCKWLLPSIKRNIWECGDVIRIVGLYLGVVPPTCILVLSILWLFFVIDGWHLLSEGYIHFLLWTLIDSFLWKKIVHGISCDISGWYHQYAAYSTSIRWSRVTLSYLPGSVDVACSPILSVSFEGMGCEPTLNLAATPDEAVSIICTVVNKNTSNFMGKVDVCELYYWLASVQ